MKKQILKIGTIAICFILIITAMTACGKDAIKIGLADVDVYTYTNNVLGPKLTAEGVNRVSESNGMIIINVDADVDEVEFDLANFFANNEGYKGKKFYFTRDDVKKGDGTLIKGRAWYQVGGDASNRLYKKLGYENDDTVEVMNKTDIAALPNREGEARMYIINSGAQTGKHVVYLDPTTGSEIDKNETSVTFKLHGHNGKNATLKIKVIKAVE